MLTKFNLALVKQDKRKMNSVSTTYLKQKLIKKEITNI